METKFTTLHMEAGLCIWENMLETRAKNEALESLWDAYGTVHLRHCAIALAPFADAVFQTLTEEEQEIVSPYDWEFIPAFVGLIKWEMFDNSGPHFMPEISAREYADLIVKSFEKVETPS